LNLNYPRIRILTIRTTDHGEWQGKGLYFWLLICVKYRAMMTFRSRA